MTESQCRENKSQGQSTCESTPTPLDTKKGDGHKDITGAKTNVHSMCFNSIDMKYESRLNIHCV